MPSGVPGGDTVGRACARKFGRCGSARTAGTALSTQTNTVTSERDGSTGGLRHSAPDASDGRPTAPPATRASMKQTIAVLDVRQRRATAPAGRCAAEQVLTSLVLPRDVSNPARSASKRKEIRRFCQPLEYERRTSVPLQFLCSPGRAEASPRFQARVVQHQRLVGVRPVR